MKQVNNESGITLIEVLATLTIVVIIGSIVYSVLFQTLHANEKTKSHNELRQEANIIMTQLRSMHENGEKLWYSSNRIYTDQNQQYLLATESFHFVEAQIKNLEDSSNMKLDKNSTIINEYPLLSKSSLEVSFTIADNYGNEYTLETVFPGKSDQVGIITPSSFYNYLAYNNIFVYGSTLDIYGSNVNGAGTIVIDNSNNSDLKFSGNQPNNIDVTNIYIDKTDNNFIFDKNTKVGKKDETKIVSIKGDVELNHGGGQIYADVIYIDGNVDLSAGAKIEGRIVIITGTVTSQNEIKATEKLYVGGQVTSEVLSQYPQIIQPSIPTITFREDSWYALNGYVSGGTLQDGMKVFANSYTDNTSQDVENVVIVSKGDINIDLGQQGNFTGVLFAPNGKVFFNGKTFKGLVIAKNGFFVEDRNPKPEIMFTNITNYINEEDFPFQ